MKKIFLFLSLVSFSTLFGQTRLTTEVLVGKTKLIYGVPIPRTITQGFEIYDMTGLVPSTYNFGIGTTGVSPNWTSAGTNFTLHIPYASVSSVTGGLLSNADYTAFKNQRWSTLGNAGTVQATNFLGTTDNIGLSFRTNNVIRQTIDNAGNVGIGTTTPSSKLEITSAAANTSGLRFTNLTSASPTSTGQAIGVDANGDIVTVASGGSVPMSSLTPATATNTIDNTSFTQQWNWSTLTTGLGIWIQANALTSGRVLRLTTNNAASSPTNGILQVENLSTSQAGSIATFVSTANSVSFRSNGTNGFGLVVPTSTVHSAGSFAAGVLTTAVSTTLTVQQTKIILNNAAANITITLPAPATCPGRMYSFTRNAASTGTVTITPAAGQVQALVGTLGATTTIGLHSAAGGGVDIQFWSDGTNWYR